MSTISTAERLDVRSRRDARSPATESRLDERSAAPTKQPRLLVADDDAPMLALLGSQLRRAGYRVVECADGKSLVKWLAATSQEDAQRNLFDLVVSDIRMPGFSGLQVLEALHDQADHPPVILITAFGDRECHERAERLGAIALMDKPFDIPDLIELVDRTIEQERRTIEQERRDRKRARAAPLFENRAAGRHGPHDEDEELF